MSADPTSPGAGAEHAAAGPAAAAGGPSEEELRRAYEQELSRITSTDMIAQTVVSLLNLGARRLGLVGAEGSGAEGAAGAEQAPGGRDLEQVRDAIDGARALMGILERRIAGELGPLREALSQLQMAYAREVQAGAEQAGQGGSGSGPAGAGGGGSSSEGGQAGGEQPPPAGRRPGPAESSGRLWVPGR